MPPILSLSLVVWVSGSLVLWFSGSLVLWFSGYGSLVLWLSGSMGLWFTGSLVPWFTGSLVLWFWFSGSERQKRGMSGPSPTITPGPSTPSGPSTRSVVKNQQPTLEPHHCKDSKVCRVRDGVQGSYALVRGSSSASKGLQLHILGLPLTL